MTRAEPVSPIFREGDEVVLVVGTHQGTMGVIVRLRSDVAWADVMEHNGEVRSHPVAWLGHVVVPGRNSVSTGGGLVNRMSVAFKTECEAGGTVGGMPASAEPPIIGKKTRSGIGTAHPMPGQPELLSSRIGRPGRFPPIEPPASCRDHNHHCRPRTETSGMRRNEGVLDVIGGRPGIGDQLRRSGDSAHRQGGLLKNIKVDNLDASTTAESIRSFFEPIGTVLKVKLMLDRKTGLSRGFAFIEMPVSDADRAIATLHGKALDGQAVQIREGRQKVHGLASPPHVRNDATQDRQ